MLDLIFDTVHSQHCMQQQQSNMSFLFGALFVALILARIDRGSTNNLLNPELMSFNETISQSVLNGVESQNFSKNEIKVLRISTVHFVPYMIQNTDGNFYQGIEYQLVKMIAQELNTSLSFQTTSKHSNICDNVVLNISDICIGGIFPRENVLEHTDISVTYASDELTWCVRKAGMMPVFLSQMLIGKPEAWFGIIFIYGYGSGLILYVLIQFDATYKQRNNRDWHYTTFLVALSACLGVSPFFRPTSGVVRLYYGFMLISAFLFFQIVFSKAYDFLNNRIPWHQTSSFEEIIQNDFRLMGSQEAFNVLNQSDEISYQKMELFHICEHINECVEQLLYDGKLAVGGSRQNILNSPSYSPSTVFCFNNFENIASYPIGLYMQKGFYLKEQVNSVIRQLFEAGLVEKWLTDSRVEKYEVPYSPPEQLPVAHLGAGLVFVLGVGSLMAISTFIAEKFVFWKVKQPGSHKIWIYLEQFFDGKRHYFKNVPERLQRQNKYYVTESQYPYLE